MYARYGKEKCSCLEHKSSMQLIDSYYLHQVTPFFLFVNYIFSLLVKKKGLYGLFLESYKQSCMVF